MVLRRVCGALGWTRFLLFLFGSCGAQGSVNHRHHIKERRWLERTFKKLSLELTTACIQKNFNFCRKFD